MTTSQATRVASALPVLALVAILPVAMGWSFTPSLAPAASRFLPFAPQRSARPTVATGLRMEARGIARLNECASIREVKELCAALEAGAPAPSPELRAPAVEEEKKEKKEKKKEEAPIAAKAEPKAKEAPKPVVEEPVAEAAAEAAVSSSGPRGIARLEEAASIREVKEICAALEQVGGRGRVVIGNCKM